MAGRKVTSSAPVDEPSHKKKRRKIHNRPKDRPGQFLRLRGAFDQPVLWEFAASIPDQSPEGRRRKLPTIFYIAMPSFKAIWGGSLSAAEAALAEDEMWRHVCALLCEMQATYRPQDEPFDLQALLEASSLTAQNYRDACRTWLAPQYPTLPDIFEETAVPLAIEQGYADPDGPGSPNHLTRTRTLSGDGKVTREPGARYRTLRPKEENAELKITAETHVVDRLTGELVRSRNMQSSANLYMTGNGPVVGFKTVRLSLRGDQTNDTVIVSVRAPATKDEAACAVQAAHAVKRRLPGILGITYDTALRGTHIRELAKVSRLVTVAPVAAKRNVKGQPRVKKSGVVARVPHLRPDGVECVHIYHHHGGQLCEERLDDAGNMTLQPCADPFIRFQDNKNDHRMYLTWDVTCAAGLAAGATPILVQKLSWTVTAEPEGFNIAENLRALPPGSPRYEEAHGWRQTVENDNNQSDATKHLRRGRSSRPDWNLYDEIGWGIVQNGVTRQRKLASQRAQAEAAA